MLKDKKVRIAVMVSGGGTNLQALIDKERAGEIPSGEIKLVLSNKDTAYALERAKNAGIKAVAVTRAEYGTDFEDKIIETLEEKFFRVDGNVIPDLCHLYKIHSVR